MTDWLHLTLGELLTALQEVDWKAPPERLNVLLAGFPHMPPPTLSRPMCNTYVYRTYYFLMLLLATALVPLPYTRAHLLALPLLALALACLNNTFVKSFNGAVVRQLRRISPPLAQKLRSAGGGHAGLGAPGRGEDLRVLGLIRPLAVGLLLLLACSLLYCLGALKWTGIGFLTGCFLVTIHALGRPPNLKAKIASPREEFRAMWRGQQQELNAARAPDHTL